MPGIPRSLPLWLALALLLAAIGLGGFDRKPVRHLAPLAALVLLVVTAGFVAGCAETPTTTPNPFGTPAGTYTIKVTATSATDSHSTNVTLTVQ